MGQTLGMSRKIPLLAALVVGLMVPAVSSAASFSTKELKLTTKVGPDDATTCVIDATLYTPNGVDAAHPAPAILTTNGFGGSKDSQAAIGAGYATHGYVVLAYSGLGFGGPDQSHPNRKGSGCKITLDDPDWDGKAASQLIDFLGGGRTADDGTKVDFVTHDAVDHLGHASLSDPRVGMLGGSYGGEIQFAAASVDSRLDTIVPQITWNDLSYSLAPNDTDFDRGVTSNSPGTEKFQWVSLFFGIGVADTGSGTIGGQDQSHLGPCPNFADSACSIKAQMDATGYPDDAGIKVARHASVTNYMSQIKIPTFLAQGQVDTLFNLNESVATYNALRAQGTPVKLLWRSAGHSGGGLGASEDDEANPEAGYAGRAYVEWFDYYLRGIGDPPKLDFSYYRDWVKYPAGKDAAAAVAAAPAYPAAGDQAWFLSGDGTLAASAAAAKAGAPSFQFAAATPTSYSETSGGQAPNQDPTDAPGTFTAFTSPVLTKDTDVAGIPKLTVSLDAQPQSSTQSGDPGLRLVLFAKLYEITAAGKTVLPHGLIAPVRVPDVTKPFTITLPGIVHRFAKGSKLQLVLAASDAAYKNNNLPGQVTVNVDPTKPSTLTIPVLGDPPAAPVGTTLPPGAGQQAQVKQEGIKGSAGKLPKARSCKRNRRIIKIHFTGVKKPDRIISRKVTLNGKRLRVRGKVLRIDLRHRKAGTYRVFVLVKSKRGKVRRSARTYKVC